MKYGRLILILAAIALAFAHVPEAKLGKHRTNHVDQLRFYHPISDALITNADGDEKVRVYPEAEADTTGVGSDMTRGVSVADTFWYVTNLGDGEGRRDDYDVYWDSAGVVVRLLREGVELGSVVADSSITSPDCFFADVVENAAMADDAIDTDELVDDAVTQPKVGAGAIDSTGLAAASVHTVHLAGDIDAPLDVLGTPTYTTNKQWITNTGSAGRITGGEITDAGSQTYNVAAGTGAIRSSDSHTATLYQFDWAAASGEAIADEDDEFVFVDYNSGVPVLTFKASFANTGHDEFFLGSIVREGTVLHIVNNPDNIINFAAHVQERWRHDGFVVQEGMIIGETGTRNLTVTAGIVAHKVNEFSLPAFDSTDPDSFAQYRAATLVNADTTAYNNTQYDTGAALGNLTSNRYGVRWIYGEADSSYVSIIGTSNSVSIAGAQAEGIPSTIHKRLQTHGFLLGRIIIQEGEDTAAEIEIREEDTFTPTGATSHNGLADVQGGAAGENYHLTSAEETTIGAIGVNGFLYGDDSGVLQKDNGSGGDVTINGATGDWEIGSSKIDVDMLNDGGGAVLAGELIYARTSTNMSGFAYNTGTVDPDSAVYRYAVYADDFAVGDNAQVSWTIAIASVSGADRTFVVACSTKTDSIIITINGGIDAGWGEWDTNLEAARIRWSVIGQ